MGKILSKTKCATIMQTLLEEYLKKDKKTIYNKKMKKALNAKIEKYRKLFHEAAHFNDNDIFYEYNIEKLKEKVNEKMRELFNENEKCGNFLYIKDIVNSSTFPEPFARYFDYKKIIEYMKSFIHRGKIKIKKIRKNKELIENVDTGVLADSSFCVGCKRVIKDKMYIYHENSKQHKKKNNKERLKITSEEYNDTKGELCSLLGQFEFVDTTQVIDFVQFGTIKQHEEVFNDETQQNKKRKIEKKKIFLKCEVCNEDVCSKDIMNHTKNAHHITKLQNIGGDGSDIYNGILSIKTVLLLSKKTVEEVEDEEGVLYDRKTYEELKESGLI